MQTATVFECQTSESEPQAVIFIGLQGSGKTYYYNLFFSENYAHINLDTLRTRHRELKAIRQCLTEKRSFVVDNTNPTKADRTRYITLAKEQGYPIICYYFESKVQDCIRRNELREGKARIPAQAIAATSNKLELPSYSEGFDQIYFVPFGENAVKWRD